MNIELDSELTRLTAFTLRVERLNQEQLFAGLLTLACLLGVSEGHLFHRKTRRVESWYFDKIRKSSSEPP